MTECRIKYRTGFTYSWRAFFEHLCSPALPVERTTCKAGQIWSNVIWTEEMNEFKKYMQEWIHKPYSEYLGHGTGFGEWVTWVSLLVFCSVCAVEEVHRQEERSSPSTNTSARRWISLWADWDHLWESLGESEGTRQHAGWFSWLNTGLGIRLSSKDFFFFLYLWLILLCWGSVAFNHRRLPACATHDHIKLVRTFRFKLSKSMTALPNKIKCSIYVHLFSQNHYCKKLGSCIFNKLFN